MADVHLRLVDEIPSLPVAEVLVNLVWKWIDDLVEEPCPHVNIRLLVSDATAGGSVARCASTIDAFASRLQKPQDFAHLELIYLPSLSSLPSRYRTDEISTSIRNVERVAKARNIEVVIEEQSDVFAGECQISEEFLRRMTQKRIAREPEQQK